MNNNAENGALTQRELLRRIQELSFAKCEIELFLDTHPACASALAAYRGTNEELAPLVERYVNEFAPLSASDCIGDGWSWIDTPWPWQMNDSARSAGGND